MEQFKKNILNLFKPHYIAIVVLAVITAFLGGLGYYFSHFYSIDQTFSAFTTNGYATLDLKCVSGPFAEETDNGNVTSVYYVAYGTDNLAYIIKTNTKKSFPVYGEDVLTDEAFDKLPGITVTGKADNLTSELASYAVGYFDSDETGITMSNYKTYFGTLILDTTDTPRGTYTIFYILAAFIAFVLIVVLLTNISHRRNISHKLEKLNSLGELNNIYPDFSNGSCLYSSKLKAAASKNYFIDVSDVKNGINIIPLQDIVNVFKCNFINGEPSITNYIAFETSTGQRYLGAPSEKESQEFNSMILFLKNCIRKEGC